MEAIDHRSQLLLGQQRAAIERAANAVALQATAKVGAAGRDLAHVKARMGRDATRRVTKADEDLDCGLAAVARGSSTLVEVARREIEASTREVAMRCREFSVQFQDGTVPVAVRESREGVGP